MEEVEPDFINDEVDGMQTQVSSETSSVSGSEGPTLFTIPPMALGDKSEEESLIPVEVKEATLKTMEVKPGKNNLCLILIGIVLTVVLAFFSGLLLMKINTIERHSSIVHDPERLSIDDAERILNKNVLTVRNLRLKLEELQLILQNFDKMPILNEKQEF